jgi:PPM family protein phosphatase
MTLVLRYAVRSDVGLLREGNEDSAYAGPRLLAVADGMGGHAAGEVASALTINAMADLDSSQPDSDMLTELSSAVAHANARLQETILANPAIEGMGTTLTALLWSDGHAAVCHIGDSRGYLLREGELYQITHDHTLVQSLVDEGRISADDVSTHPQRSLLLRALDGRSVAEPDLSAHDGQPGDRYLLCSDGLSGVVSDEVLRDVLSAIADPEAATRELIDLANQGGGPDNITCIVADVVDTATTRLPPTTIPVLAGAAASVGDPRLAADGTDPLNPLGPFGGLEDHHEDRALPSLTARQPIVADDEDAAASLAIPLTVVSANGAHPGTGRARRTHHAQPRRTRSRRRWPIVTTALVVLVAAIVGGLYVFWRWTQDQYYVAVDSKNQVVIYQGLSQPILGISLSRPYKPTGIALTQVPSDDQQALKTASSSGSLADVQKTVANVRAAVTMCQNQYMAQQNWAAAWNDYNSRVALAKLLKEPTNRIPKPQQQQQPEVSRTCPLPGEFGISTSTLKPALPGPS